METIKTLLIACVPAIISSVLSFVLAKHQTKSEIEKMQLANKHDLEKLMEQHRVDINAIQEKHRLEMDAKEKDHQYKLELIQKGHENELIRKKQELENATKYNVAGNILTGVFNSVLGGALSSPELQGEIEKKIMNGVRAQETEEQQNDES